MLSQQNNQHTACLSGDCSIFNKLASFYKDCFRISVGNLYCVVICKFSKEHWEFITFFFKEFI